MIDTSELKSLLKSFIPDDDKPIIIYSGLWYIGRAINIPFRDLPNVTLETLFELAGSRRTIVMPTYTNGFKNGLIDLDNEPSQTGVLTEIFRKSPGVKRTASAFFSFAAHGPEAAMLENLTPTDAWGDDSIFQWMEERDAHLLTIGEPWEACSLKHRSEWITQVPYRYLKEFKGKMIRKGKTVPLTERLFVRSLDPEVDIIWHNLIRLLESGGMKQTPVGAGHIGHMSSRQMLNVLVQKLKVDPFAFTHDPEKIRALFS
jgi:aminoglycoside 3-N-acetyltransferase